MAPLEATTRSDSRDSGLIYIDSEIPALPARPNGVAGRAGRGDPERDAEINSA